MQHVFFDLDGTLTDPAEGIVRCLQFALDAMAAPARSASELQHFIGPPLHGIFSELLGTAAAEPIARAVDFYRQRFSVQGLYENAVYGGIPELLRELRGEGLSLWVVTSKPTVFADRIIDHFGLRQFFNRVYGSELSGERADKRELLAYVLERESIRPEQACMIGDRKYDISGASANRVAALGVLWGYGSRAELEAAGAHGLVESPAGLSDHVRQLRDAVDPRSASLEPRRDPTGRGR